MQKTGAASFKLWRGKKEKGTGMMKVMKKIPRRVGMILTLHYVTECCINLPDCCFDWHVKPACHNISLDFTLFPAAISIAQCPQKFPAIRCRYAT